MKYKVDGKVMFKALSYHSNGQWTADYRVWSKDKQKFGIWAKTPEEALLKLLVILKEQCNSNS